MAATNDGCRSFSILIPPVHYQWTPKDRVAAMKVHAPCDDVLLVRESPPAPPPLNIDAH